MLHDPDVVKHVDELNDEGVSALHLAARFNHLQIVKLLVDMGKAGIHTLYIRGVTLSICNG